MRVSSTALRHVRELLVVVECPVLCCANSSHARAPSSQRDLCSISGFRVHVPDLALAHDVLYLNLVFVRTCPRLFPLCVCRSVEFLIWHSHRISFVFTSNVVSSFLLPHIKARLRVESCFNCAARSSDLFNCEFTSAFQSVASFNKYSMLVCMLWLCHSSLFALAAFSSS